jgi:hypothetical protein
VPHHPQPGYKRDARMDKSIIIHMIIRAPSRVSPQTFVNFVYLYVNKQFTTQRMLKVAPNVGHNVKNIFIRSWKLSNAASAKYLDGWIPKTSKFVHKIFGIFFS